mgnify:CR=1 FL=1
MTASRLPADQAVRDRVVTDFDTTFLLEAGAGTGKTTVATNLASYYAVRGHKVALADFDRDGDLDAVFGNEGQANKIYLNTEARLAAVPLWSSDPKLNTASVAVGDVEHDDACPFFCEQDRCGASDPRSCPRQNSHFFC